MTKEEVLEEVMATINYIGDAYYLTDGGEKQIRQEISDLLDNMNVKYKSQRDRLLDATKNIISISDRKHDFYDTAKAIIKEIEQESKE